MLYITGIHRQTGGGGGGGVVHINPVALAVPPQAAISRHSGDEEVRIHEIGDLLSLLRSIEYL